MRVIRQQGNSVLCQWNPSRKSPHGKPYNYFRDYDAAIGRYVESDPIGLEGGLNTYGYVEGRPLRYSDARGLQAAAAGAAAIGCGAITVCYFVPNCRKAMEDGTRRLITAIAAAAASNGGSGSGNDSKDKSGNAASADGTQPQTCSTCPPPVDPCDKKLSDKLLQSRDIDPHSIKREMLGSGGWGSYNLCGCKDGRIVLKKSADCKGPGGDATGEFWK